MSLGLRIVFALLPIGLMLGGVMSLVFWAKQPEHFPLRSMEIQQELKWVSPESISSTVSKYMSGGFFGLNVEELQQSLSALPWTLSVKVQRVWPDRISISVTEQTPLARFGDRGIMSTEGKVFYPEEDSLSKLPKNLPVFKGPEHYAKEMLQNYFALLEMLAPLGLTISELSFSPECSLHIRLDNGIAIIIGKSAMLERMGRFVTVYPRQLQKEMDKIGYLDLRYTNGFAIGWKTPASVPVSPGLDASMGLNSSPANSGFSTLKGVDKAIDPEAHAPVAHTPETHAPVTQPVDVSPIEMGLE